MFDNDFVGVVRGFLTVSAAILLLIVGSSNGQKDYKYKLRLYATTSEVQILDRLDTKIKKEARE